MADNSTILEKLDGLVARFEEISTLITDPAVIADQKRYVKLTKEYKELDDLMKARKEYIQLLGNIEEAKNILATESDADIREMAKEEMDLSQERLPVLELSLIHIYRCHVDIDRLYHWRKFLYVEFISDAGWQDIV